MNKRRGHPSRTTVAPQQKPFSLLVKPAGADCNLACAYCFYLKKAALYPETRTHRMNDAVLERMVQSYLATQQPVYSFGWQGGEPTLMGLEFFQKVTTFQQRHGRPGTRVANGLQTNGVLIGDEFAEHLARYHFLVGLSLDGPAEMHDRYRRYPGGGGAHADVASALRRLQSHGVEVNVLVLVSKANVEHAAQVYRYVTDLGIRYLQFIPCLEVDGTGTPLPYAISGEEWGRFLVEIFDIWHDGDTRRVSVRDFDAVMGFLLDGSYSSCTLGGRCDHYFVVEHTGDVFPCDFFVEPDLKLGNVMTDSWQKLAASPVRSRFAGRKSQWPAACQSCAYLPVCSGDCPKHRLAPDGRSMLCAGWKRFYAHALSELRSLAQSVAAHRGLQGPLWDPVDVDPEAPCFCGSGKKAKNCHLKAHANQSITA
jgi:uncharacterized protein